jgi:hypothetical protein
MKLKPGIDEYKISGGIGQANCVVLYRDGDPEKVPGSIGEYIPQVSLIDILMRQEAELKMDRPSCFAVDPAKGKLLFHPSPDKAYHIMFNFYPPMKRA